MRAQQVIDTSSRSRALALWALALAVGCGSGARDDSDLYMDNSGLSAAAESAESDALDDAEASAGHDTSSADEGTTGPNFDVGNGSAEGASDDGGPPQTCDEALTSQTNSGCEFWAVDLPQAWWIESGTTSPENGKYAVAVANASAEQSAAIRVYVGDQDVVIDEASVDVGELHVFQLPALSINAQASSANGQAYRIESDVPVTAYQFNTLEQTDARYSADASLLVPTHVLRADYTAITGDAIYAGAPPTGYGEIGAFISIVAQQDDTTVDVYPTATLLAGAASQGVVLGRGQVLTLISSTGGQEFPMPGLGNLTGSRVAASGPVAVFAGNVASREPVGSLETLVCCADHLEEQMLPLSAWGNSYASSPTVSPNNAGAWVKTSHRLIGSVDGTSLQYSPAPPPGAPTTIDAYEVAYFVATEAFTVTGSEPFGVAQFLVGSGATSMAVDADGDPASILLPAADQWQASYVFLTPPTFATNYIAAFRPEGAELLLDGAAASGSIQPVGEIDGTAYEAVHIAVAEGGHAITSESPFAIVVYGFADFTSYGYVGGSGFSEISQPPPVPAG